MAKGKFERFGSAGEYRFRLKASNGETILASEGYTSAAGRDNGIASVKENAPLDERYDRKTAKDGSPYFNLKAANGEVIGTSEMYSSEAARDKGIESVRNHAPVAEIVDVAE